MKPVTRRFFDLSALSLSGLCLAHCLALPVAALLLPALSSWAKADWVHGVFAAMAVPVTVAALWGGRRHGIPAGLVTLAASGVGLLILGSTNWLGAASNTPLTIVGAVLLAIAHTWNWRRHKKAHLLDDPQRFKPASASAPLPADLA